MKPNHVLREVVSGGVSGKHEFQISHDDSAHIMTILRDTLYSDKVLALIREYSSNAWDSHRQSGKPDLPIKVGIPTHKDPTFTIQDFGSGLSHDDVFQVYTQYGKSTKRNDDNAVGMLGIGSKSAFAYSDSFTITSCHDGKRRVYVAVIDESEKGYINLLSEEDCGEETGVTIQVPVKPQDIREFTGKAQMFFEYFLPRPEINIELPPEPKGMGKLKNGAVWRPGLGPARQWHALMGCVPYRVNLSQITKGTASVEGSESVSTQIETLGGVLFFEVGDLQFSASREELKYSEKTKKALIQKFNDLIDEFVSVTLKDVEDKSSSIWDRRVRSQVLNEMKIPVPKEYKFITSESVDLFAGGVPLLFKFLRRGVGSVRNMDVSATSRFLLKDDDRKIQGFQIQGDPVLIERLDEKTSWDDVTEELIKIIGALEIDGIPIGKISDCSWVKPYEAPPPPKKVADPKHRVCTFVLSNTGGCYGSKKSDHWKIETRKPTKDDVYVILYGFQTHGYDFYKTYNADRELAGFFGKGQSDLPRVFGYKTTAKKPVKAEDLEGKEYREWRRAYVKSLLTADVKKKIELSAWADIFESENYRFTSERVEMVGKVLGEDHLINQVFRKRKKAKKFRNENGWGLLDGLEELRKRTRYVPQASKIMDSVFARYPLIRISGGFKVLWEEHSAEWVKYINLIDSSSAPALSIDDQEKEGTDGNGTEVHTDERVDHGRVEGQAVHDGEGIAELPPPQGGAPREEVGGGGGSPDVGEEPVDVDGRSAPALLDGGRHSFWGPGDAGVPRQPDPVDDVQGGEPGALPEVLEAAPVESIVQGG